MTEHALNRVRNLAQDRQIQIEVRYAGGSRPLMESWLGADLSYCPQGSGDLGVRMARAFSAAFSQGVDRMAIVGTDCPGITAETSRTALDLLEQFDLVIGPAHDGGYYLIGLRQTQPQLFSDIPWGTSRVLAKTLDIADKLNLRVVNLEPMHDVDRPEDLQVWEREANQGESPPLGISVIIPTLDEKDNVSVTLKFLQNVSGVEIIVVDGGSTDGTVQLVKSSGARMLSTSMGRASQLNAGALAANGGVLLFLHTDTRLPDGFQNHVFRLLARPHTVAGAFQLGIAGPGAGLRLIEKVANLRSRFLQLPYGDQAIFLKADLFRFLGGFPDMPIMEDFVFMQRIKKYGRVAIVPLAVNTSARRWLKFGTFRTTLINQLMIAGYYLGVEPSRLARWYRQGLQNQARHKSSA
jgi:rSAM/selenodomain-associated transferase 2/rSAM/selenodomain-associated transferase 1